MSLTRAAEFTIHVYEYTSLQIGYSKWSAPTSSPVAMHTKPSARRQACRATAMASCGDLASHTARHFSKTVSKFSSIWSHNRLLTFTLRRRWRHLLSSTSDKKANFQPTNYKKLFKSFEVCTKFGVASTNCEILHHTTLNTAPHSCGPLQIVKSLRFFFFRSPPEKLINEKQSTGELSKTKSAVFEIHVRRWLVHIHWACVHGFECAYVSVWFSKTN